MVVVVFMPIFECFRKVQSFGTSLALTLPALFVKANEVEKGSVMKVYYGLEGVLVISRFDEPETLKKRVIEIIDKLSENNFEDEKKGEHDV